MERTNGHRELTIFTVFSGPVEEKGADQMAFSVEPQRGCINRISWSAIEFAAALRRCTYAQQHGGGTEVTTQNNIMRTIERKSRRKGATHRALMAIENGDANFVNQLSSTGGSSKTMETVIDAMVDVDTREGRHAITAARGQASSAAGGMFLFGDERWIERDASVLIHGRGVVDGKNSDDNKKLRERALEDMKRIYHPRLRAISKGTEDQGESMVQIIRRAASNRDNPRMEFILDEQELLQTRVATDVFDDGEEMWDAVHARTRIGDVLGGTRKPSTHPLKQFYLEPPAVPARPSVQQSVGILDVAAQANKPL
tara:strand:+ start:184 stop:1122 length:939 start_codon:yes stop_codon:yes gene_type:complete